MQSAFGVDHGDFEKGLFGAGGSIQAAMRGGARALRGGSHSAGGMPKMFGGGAAGAHSAGAHAGSPVIRNPFASVSGGAKKMFGAHTAVPGGARKAGAHAGPMKMQNPFGSSGGARKAGAHAAGRRKAI